MNEEDAEKVDFEGAKVLHLTGIPPALSQSCRNATYRMIERARENAMIVTFDPNLRPTLWESKSVMIRTINDLASRQILSFREQEKEKYLWEAKIRKR